MTYPTVMPYMSIRNAAGAMDFYTKAFGATEIMRNSDDAGKLRHGELRLGDSVLMLHDESPNYPEMKTVQAYGGSPVNLFLYLDDVDAVYNQAVAAGAKALGPLQEQPYGRTAGVVDPFGLTWWLCSKPR